MDVTSATAQSGTTPKPSQGAAAKVSGDYQMFLKMLTAQMKNQDPLNPIQSSDYAVQLATFSGVEQQVKTNELLAALTGQLGVSGMGQIAGWVGMEARSAAPVPFRGQPLTVFPAPAADADRAVLVAYDAQGKEVTRQDIPVSSNPINWTGATATGGSVLHGAYSFKVESYAGTKLLPASQAEAYVRVTEVRQGDKGAVLVLDGGGQVAPADVKALRPPQSGG